MWPVQLQANSVEITIEEQAGVFIIFASCAGVAVLVALFFKLR